MVANLIIKSFLIRKKKKEDIRKQLKAVLKIVFTFQLAFNCSFQPLLGKVGGIKKLIYMSLY